MPLPLIGFLAFCFVGMTAINRVLEGAFITASDVTVIHQLTVFAPLRIGFFTVPVPNLSFISVAIPRLISWDYSFFGGNAGIIQYFLYAITAVISFALFFVVLGLLYNFFSRVRG